MSHSITPLLEQIQANQPDMLKQTITLAEINSGSLNHEGINKVAEGFRSLYESLADSIETVPLANQETVDDQGERQVLTYPDALVIRKRPNAPFQVLLGGHLDTVFAKDHPFQSCRWLDDNTINGPGTADIKAGLVVMHQALLAFEDHPLAEQLGWTVVLNPDEETGSIGSAALLAEEAQKAHVGMVYEPALADGTLAGARKGSGNFTLTVKGRSAHAGREFDKGRNAIAALAEAMSRLHRFNEHKGLTLNLGKIQGGGALNVVADLAQCRFNIRTLDPSCQQDAERALKELVSSLNQQDGIQASLAGQFNRSAKPMTPAIQQLFDWLSDCGDRLGVSVSYKATGGCCDGNNLAAAGLPNIDTLGVRGGLIHTPQEFFVVDSLAERAKLSLLLLDKLVTHQEQWLKLKQGASC